MNQFKFVTNNKSIDIGNSNSNLDSRNDHDNYNFKNSDLYNNQTVKSSAEIEYNKIIDSLSSIQSLLNYSKTITPAQLIQTKEFTEASYCLLHGYYSNAENIFRYLKNSLRAEYLGTKIYCISSRRLGISLLLQKGNKSKLLEGLTELENVFEYTQNGELYESYQDHFNAIIDLLNAYTKYLPSRVII